MEKAKPDVEKEPLKMIFNSQCDQLPDSFIAQLVERYTGIAEVMDSNPVQAWIFFQALISQLLTLCVKLR